MAAEPFCIKAFHCPPLAKKCHFPPHEGAGTAWCSPRTPVPTTARGSSTFLFTQIFPLPQGLPGLRQSTYILSTSRVKRINPLLHHFKPLHVNSTTISSEFCPAPLGCPTGCHNPAKWTRGSSGFINTGHWISSFAQVTLFTTKTPLQRLSRVCKLGDPSKKGSL